jgi:nucleoside-diphosphate-sugar epimerase
MRVAVTEAAGHLGSNLIPALRREGLEVAGLDMAVPAAPLPDGCAFRQINLADAAAVKPAIAGADLIVHCASIHPWKPYTDDQYLDANVKGTWHLYTAAADLGIRRVVLTSSIAAVGYAAIPRSAWPVGEHEVFPLGDLYSFTKHAQETIARLYAAKGAVRTVALRPPAFMPRPDLETGFGLTGVFAVVEDIAAAHVAAVRVMLGRQRPLEPLEDFEAFNVTNRLPYTAEDAALIGPDNDMRPLVRKYWPAAYEWLVSKGFRGGWLPAVYDISKAKGLLSWEPRFNFEEWYVRHGQKER